MKLLLQRLSRTLVCTQGSLAFMDRLVRTLERPWIPSLASPGGQHGISCVPAGTYDLLLHDSELHPRTFALSNALLGVLHYPDARYPDARVAILIHVANQPVELQGCIGVGMNAGNCSLIESRVAYQQLQSTVPWTLGHTLLIKDAP